MAALRRLRGSHRVTILAAGLVAVAVALAAEATHVVEAQEQDTIGLRFQAPRRAAGDRTSPCSPSTTRRSAALGPLAVPAVAPRARGRRAARRGRARDRLRRPVQRADPARATTSRSTTRSARAPAAPCWPPPRRTSAATCRPRRRREPAARSAREAASAAFVTADRDRFLRFPYAAGGLPARRGGRPARRPAACARRTSRRRRAGSTTAGRPGTIPTVSVLRRSLARPRRARAASATGSSWSASPRPRCRTCTPRRPPATG